MDGHFVRKPDAGQGTADAGTKAASPKGLLCPTCSTALHVSTTNGTTRYECVACDYSSTVEDPFA